MKQDFFEYIGQDLFNVYVFSNRLIEAVNKEKFEYDTAEFDEILQGIKRNINKIDI